MFRAPQWHGATQTHFPPRPRKSQWRCDITNFASPHGLPRHYRSNMSHDTTNHPATSDTLRLRQPVSRSPVARGHANTLPTQAAQIPMALRHHERRVATRSAHTLEANMSHDTKNHPAHQRHAAFTPACFALPSRTPPHKHTFHQGCANPNGTATSRMSRRHTVCRHTRIVMRAFRTTRSHASKPLRGCKTSVSYETSSKSHASSRLVRDFLQKSHVKSPKQTFQQDFLQKSSGNTHRSTHITQPCQAVLRFQSLQKQHPPTRQSQCDSDIHLYYNSQPHDSLRLPRIFPRPHV